jgi:uncharacterized protein (TIGR02145 family)
MKTTSFICILFISFSISCQTKQTSQVLKDIDGNAYNTVTIGTQTWMAENLRVTKYRDGTSIPIINDRTVWTNDSIGACCFYNNDPANGKIYGMLYNAHAILNPKNLAPKGWHIPSDKEWQSLVDYLGGDKVAGGKLKEKGNVYWLENIGATNQTGFSALPAGECRCYIQVDGKKSSFDWLGLRTFFASSTEWGNTIIWVRDLQNLNGGINRMHGGGCSGISIRCIKD